MVEYLKSLDSGTSIVMLRGHFTVSDNQRFRALIAEFGNKGVNSIIFDFANVEFIDSAALGMLLLGLDESRRSGKRMVLRHPQGQVKKIFDVSRFKEIFEIVE